MTKIQISKTYDKYIVRVQESTGRYSPAARTQTSHFVRRIRFPIDYHFLII